MFGKQSSEVTGTGARAAAKDFRSVLEEQKSRFAEQTEKVAEAFCRAGEHLTSEGHEAGRYARWIGDEIGSLSRFLRERGVEQLAKQVRQVGGFAGKAKTFASRGNQRWIVVGSAALVGFGLYYFLTKKNSNRDEG